MSELLKEQEEFIEWLKSKNMYNSLESGYTMSRMHEVWKEAKKEEVEA